MTTTVCDNAVTLDRTVAYAVDGYSGVAWRVLGPATTTTYEGDVLVCNDDECDHLLSEVCWTEGDYERVYDESRVRAVMIGDDREHTFDVEELTPLDRDEFCGECGQIGCGHG